MKKIKVLHIYKTSQPFSYGGVESVIANLADKLNNNHIQSDVACIGNQTKIFRPHNFNIYSYKKTFEVASCPFSFSMLFQIRKIIKNYDVIHYHYPWPFADILHIFFGHKKKTVVTYHSDIIKQRVLKYFYSPLEFLFLRCIDKIVATSPQYTEISPNLKRFKKKVSVFPIGIKKIDCSKITNVTHFNLPKKYFVFVGVLRYYKGLHIALEALAGTNLNFVIIGDGPIKSELEKIIKKLKIEKQVFFLGKLSDAEKHQVIKNSIALVLPSHLVSEAFGVVLLEAASLAKPMISCKIGTGTEYANLDQETGFCVNPNPEELQNAMIKLTNNYLSTKLGQQAKKRFEKFFSADIMAQNYLSLYSILCSKK